MLASVLICYAIVLQALFGSLASASPQGSDGSAFMTVICHAESSTDSKGDPARDIQAKHHCVLCPTGAFVATAAAPAHETASSLIDRRAAIIVYARRQDPATAPLYLPPRVSRGPPLTA